MANLLDKNDRAVRAFIATAVAGFNAGTVITVRNNSQLRQVIVNGNAVGIVDVDSQMGNENPVGSGCYEIIVMVRVKYPAANQPNQKDQSSNRVLLGKLQDAVVNQLHLTGGTQDYAATAIGISAAGNALIVDGSNGTDPVEIQRAADDADMANYSCLDVMHTSITGGKNTKEPGDMNFYELCNFKCLVAGFGAYWGDYTNDLAQFLSVTYDLLTPLVNNTGAIIKWPFKDIDGNIRYLRIVDDLPNVDVQ